MSTDESSLAGPSADSFDREFVAAALLGTWYYPAPDGVSGMAYVHFSECGRFFQFVIHPEWPDRLIPMRLWYSVESVSELRVRSKSQSEGSLVGYVLDGFTLTLTNPSGRSFFCQHAQPWEIPAWFQAALAEAKLKP